jgi:hypothetical protein
MVANGSTIPLDGVTIATLALVLWMLVSLVWTESRHSVLELFVWMSYLTLFTAARSIPIDIVMWILLPNAAILSGLQLYGQSIPTTWFMDHGVLKNYHDRQFPIFGNSNHSAAFLLMGFFSALWLATNIDPWLWVFVTLIGFAIALSRCRGAMIAMVVSMIIWLAITKTKTSFYVTALAILFVLINGQRLLGTLRGLDLQGRLYIYKDAIKRINPRYLMGRGLNYYRNTEYGRVHNDHIEIIGEIGLIGYLLFLNIFYQISFDPIVFCAFVAMFIMGMVFYPFRETHTVTSFWAMMGAGAGYGITGSMFPLKVSAILALIAVMIFVFTVYSNLLNFSVKKEA